jgi:sugar phosphate permease
MMPTKNNSNRYRIHYAWVVLTIGTLTVFGALGLARFSYSLVLPSMQTALGLDNTGAGGLATANLTGYLLLSLVGGALASKYGPRLLISIGMSLTGSSMMLTGTVGSMWSALLWRAVTGLGSGASNVPTMALMSAWFGPGMRGLAAGVAATGSSIGLIVTGPLVPRLITVFGGQGWRFSWYIFGGAVLLIAAVNMILLRNDPSSKGLGLLGGAKTQNSKRSATETGLRWGKVYRSTTVWHLGIIYATFGFSYIIYVTFFVKYLVGELGYTAQAAGNLFMLMGWFSLGCGFIWGPLSDLLGRRPALVLIQVIQALSFLIFGVWQSAAGLTLSAVLFGLTAWSIPAVMAATCGDVVGHRLAPAALGFVTFFLGLGQAAGPSIGGIIADMTDSFKGAFILSAAVALAGALGSMFLKTAKNT